MKNWIEEAGINASPADAKRLEQAVRALVAAYRTADWMIMAAAREALFRSKELPKRTEEFQQKYYDVQDELLTYVAERRSDD